MSNKLKKGQKLSEGDRLELLNMYNQRAAPVEIISRFKVTNARIYQILHELEAMGHKVAWVKKF